MLRILLILMPLVVFAFSAEASKRVALVIGNSDYIHATPLRNPANDATAMSKSLERLNFEVLQGIDLDHDATLGIVREFSSRVQGADIALFYFAGHGIQVKGKNYLIPADGNFSNGEADLDFAAIDVDLIMRQMERGATTRILLLDACRNNPFERQLARRMGATRSSSSLGRGLAPINNDGGALFAFATRPGEVAYDGDGRHSPFTKALLDHIEAPGLEINRIMTRVRRDVRRATDGQQLPYTSSVLLNDVFLSEPVAVPEEPDQTSEDIAAWKQAERGASLSSYEAYLATFPNGIFAEFARDRLAELTDAIKKPPTQPELPATGSEVLTALQTPDGPRVSFGAPSVLQAPDASPSQVPDVAFETTPAIIADIQRELDRLNCRPGGADGKWGRNSAAALKRFSDASQDPSLADARPTLALWNRLRNAQGVACETPPIANATPSTPRKSRRNCFVFNGARVCE